MNPDRQKPELLMQAKVLYAVAALQPVSTKDLCDLLKVSRMTLNRQFASLERNFGVRIRFSLLKTGTRGRRGLYSIEDWGVIHRFAFMEQLTREIRRDEEDKAKQNAEASEP